MAMVVIIIFDAHGHAFWTSMAMVVITIFDAHGHGGDHHFRRP
jgi:hypothetical protein